MFHRVILVFDKGHSCKHNVMAKDSRIAPAAKHFDLSPRKLQLVAEPLPGRYGLEPCFAFALQEVAERIAA